MKQAIFIVLLAVALGCFAWTMIRYIRVMMRGTPDPRPRFDRLAERVGALVVFFFGQKKVVEHQVRPALSSWHHIIIFWGFLVIQLGTAELILNGLFAGFRWSILIGGTLYSGLRGIIDVFNLLVLLMVIWAAFRRTVIRPRLIPMNLDAALVL